MVPQPPEDDRPATPARVDPRWVRLALLSAAASVGSYLMGTVWLYLPGVPPGARGSLAAVFSLCTATVCLAWLVIKAFDMFDVEGLRDSSK